MTDQWTSNRCCALARDGPGAGGRARSGAGSSRRQPSNILLENGVERVKLTDFGLARAVDDASLTQSGVVAGTPRFMSPEQARASRSTTAPTSSAWERSLHHASQAITVPRRLDAGHAPPGLR